jgi:alkylation response protein AidB-like acyl-CoA dehydrogenase
VDAEDFRQIRDAVRQLVRESVVPREEQIEDEDRIPDDLRAQAADMGLFGYALPEEYGGLGVTMSEDVQLAFEFGYTTPPSVPCSAPTTASPVRSSPSSAPTSRRRPTCRGWPKAR